MVCPKQFRSAIPLVRAGAWLAAAALLILPASDSLAATTESKPAPAASQSQPASMPVYARAKVPDPAELVPAAPREVCVGIYLMRMTSVDITRNMYSVDFYVWFRWKDEDIKPYETFELINGSIDSRQLDCIRQMGPFKYACVRVTATVSETWDVRRFPLGKQSPSISIEDNDKDVTGLVYLPDTENSAVDDNLKISGWKVERCRCAASGHTYKTNYGYPRTAAPTATFSRFIFTIDIQRNGLFHSLKIFSGLYMAVLVAFTAFFVKPEHRLGVNIGSVFAVVASHTVISSYLPEVGVLTLCDKLHLVTVGVILVSLFETAYSLHLTHMKHSEASKKLDRTTFWITAPIFLIANILLFLN